MTKWTIIIFIILWSWLIFAAEAAQVKYEIKCIEGLQFNVAYIYHNGKVAVSMVQVMKKNESGSGSYPKTCYSGGKQ